MALTAEQEQNRIRYNASVEPEYQLSPRQYESYLSQGHNPGATKAMASGSQPAKPAQKPKPTPKPKGDNLNPGAPYVAVPMAPTAASMTASNMQAHNIPVSGPNIHGLPTLPGGDRIESSPYSSMGSGISRLGATNPQQAVDDYRGHLAAQSAQNAANTQAKLNDPANIAFQQQLHAPKAPGVRAAAQPSGVAQASSAALQEQLAAETTSSQPSTIEEKAQAILRDPKVPERVKLDIRTAMNARSSDPKIASKQKAHIERLVGDAYTKYFPEEPTETKDDGKKSASSAYETALAASNAALPQTTAAPINGASPVTTTSAPVTTAPNTGLTQELADTFQQAYDESRQANLQRYEDILAGYSQRTTDALGLLDKLGGTAREDIGAQYDRLRSRNEQDLISRGLGNTTVRNSAMRGVEEDRERANRRLDEQLAAQRLGVMSGLTGDQLSFMERRDDPAPDLGMLANLTQGVGAAGDVAVPNITTTSSTSTAAQPEVWLSGVGSVPANDPRAIAANTPKSSGGPAQARNIPLPDSTMTTPAMGALAPGMAGVPTGNGQGSPLAGVQRPDPRLAAAQPTAPKPYTPVTAGQKTAYQNYVKARR